MSQGAIAPPIDGPKLPANFPSKTLTEPKFSQIAPPSTCRECRVRSRALYSQVPDEEIERRRRSRRLVRARRTIIREGERPQEAYTILDGWAFSYKLLADGRRQIISFLLPGDFVSLQSLRSEKAAFSVQALTDVVLCCFPMNVMCEWVVSQGELTVEAQARCLAYSLDLEDRLTDLGRRNAEERLARLFLDLYGRLEKLGALNHDGNCPFPLRQEHMADALGLTAVHVSRVLTLLKAEQLITLRSGALTLLDVPRLRAIVGRGRY